MSRRYRAKCEDGCGKRWNRVRVGKKLCLVCIEKRIAKNKKRGGRKRKKQTAPVW